MKPVGEIRCAGLPYRVRRWGPAAGLWLMLLGAACQDETPLPLAGTGFDPRQPAALRLRPAEPCTDLVAGDALLAGVLEAVNLERRERQLDPLILDPTLMRIADFYACRMAESDFLSHVDPHDGSSVDSRARDFGYAFLKIGENLALGQRSAGQVVADWMASAGHRANILDPSFTQIGVAVKTGTWGGPYWVQEFGRQVTDGWHPALRASIVTSAPVDVTSSAPDRGGDLDGAGAVSAESASGG